MTGPAVALESIAGCLQGAIPSPFATCSADGTPNVTYLSIVHYVDAERVAVSRQFLNKTRANLEANPQSQTWVIDPETFQQYVFDLRYLHTEADGPIFEAMRANLEGIASQTGMGNVFRLRGVDIHRVVRCEAVGARTHAHERDAAAATGGFDAIRQLDDFVRRVARCGDYDEAATTVLQALDDLFGFGHATLLVTDEGGDGLFAVAGNGYPASAAGAEVPLGAGVIGVAAQRRQVVCVDNLARSRAMQTAVRASLAQRGEELPGRDIPLPRLDDAQSVAAVPLLVHGAVVGVLYLESARPGAFAAHERLLRIVGGHVATALAALGRDRHETVGRREERVAADAVDAVDPGPRGAAGAANEAADPVPVAYYQADDSVFVAGEYVIKGVPGRILWKLLREHAADGRTAFTNRELRLDERLGLPAGNDNLEARLLVLRRRLDGAEHPIRLERTGRGRLTLHVARRLELAETETTGPMRAAHAPPSGAAG